MPWLHDNRRFIVNLLCYIMLFQARRPVREDDTVPQHTFFISPFEHNDQLSRKCPGYDAVASANKPAASVFMPATTSCTEPQPVACYLCAIVAKDWRRKAWKPTRALRAPGITSSLATTRLCLFVPCTMTLSNCGVKHCSNVRPTVALPHEHFLCRNAQRKTPTHLLRFPRRRQWPLFSATFMCTSQSTMPLNS